MPPPNHPDPSTPPEHADDADQRVRRPVPSGRPLRRPELDDDVDTLDNELDDMPDAAELAAMAADLAELEEQADRAERTERAAHRPAPRSVVAAATAGAPKRRAPDLPLEPGEQPLAASTDDLTLAPEDALPTLDSTIKGEVSHVVFSSPNGEYAVIRLLTDGMREHVLVGGLADVVPGEDIEATGHWETHREHGRQFRVTHHRAILPTTATGIARYLGSGVIPGIGPKMAERIVEKFGTETLTILDKYSSRLTEVSGFGKSRLAAVRDAWQAQSERRETYIFLQGLNISPAYCDRIYKRYGDLAAKVVQENPYRLADDVRGIGFRMADAVAARLNIAKDHPFRLGAGLLYTLNQLSEQDGHTGYPRDLLIERAAETLGVSPEVAELGLQRAAMDGAAVIDEHGLDPGLELVYPFKLFQAEVELGDLVRTMLAIPPTALSPGATSPPGSIWDKLNAEQRAAVKAAFATRLSIVTGGPGVGKTTVTREIVSWAKDRGMRVALAAPTGRAAKRLSESTRMKAMTLHRLLRWEADKGKFFHGQSDPLPQELIIVDEVSMLDIELATQFFRAVGPQSRVVLVGDRDQLPSVGPGSVLRDFIRSACCPVTQLDTVYRQAANSRIITAAHAVNKGHLPEMAPPDDKDELRDFYWINAEDAEKCVDTLVKLVSERIPQRFGLSARSDIQVLAPMARGIAGVVNLNYRLQKAINPKANGVDEMQVRETTFRVGDRVMQISNNYDKGVFNGEQGRISSIDHPSRTFFVDFDIGPVPYPFDDADQLRLAYAITIHKSQGSEFPAVVVPLLNQHYVMLQRNLVYTAMTRAAKLLVMLGGKRAFNLAVRNVNQSPRHSRLADRLMPRRG